MMPQAFSKRVEMSGCFGMALEGSSLDFAKQREFLGMLGKIPVLLRFFHHEGREQWAKSTPWGIFSSASFRDRMPPQCRLSGSRPSGP